VAHGTKKKKKKRSHDCLAGSPDSLVRKEGAHHPHNVVGDDSHLLLSEKGTKGRAGALKKFGLCLARNEQRFSLA